jgi:predicted glycosyltransferase
MDSHSTVDPAAKSVTQNPGRSTLSGQESGAGVRLLMYSHDTFGLGHLRRCLKLAEAFSQAFPGLSTLLVTGSPVVHRYTLPPGVDYIKLPAVRKTGSEKYEARLLETSFDRILDVRTEMLKEAVRGFAPHLVLVDHSPKGMKGEMLPALEWLKQHRAETRVMLGLRDIIDDPAQVTELWHREDLYSKIDRYYDGIFVYGHPAVYDLITEYQFPQSLLTKSVYCGYVSDPVNTTRLSRRKAPSAGRPLVVVTIGGGDGAVDTVIEPYLYMLRSYGAAVTFDTVILSGAFLSREQIGQLRRASKGLPVSIRTHVTSTRSLFSRAEVVVATAGYNTTTDLLAYARRALLIPRMMHRKEQFIRAKRLAELGLVSFLHPGHITPESLYLAVHAALNDDRAPLVDARARQRIPLDGCRQVARECRRFIAACRDQMGAVS